MGPLHHAITGNLVPNHAVLFHCNYAGGHELALLSAKNVSVVVCPQYTQALGHKRLPLDVALSRKVTLCVGTESEAEAQSANLFDELHFLKRQYPHLPAQELLHWVTRNPARALRMQGGIGVLAGGAFADMIAVSFAHDPGEDILEELLEEQPIVRFVMVNGEEVIVDY
jgi:cytosine/adenosine deaminase-related metal-dependent hydrolase